MGMQQQRPPGSKPAGQRRFQSYWALHHLSWMWIQAAHFCVIRPARSINHPIRNGNGTEINSPTAPVLEILNGLNF